MNEGFQQRRFQPSLLSLVPPIASNPSRLDATMEPQQSTEAKLDDGVHRFLDEYFKLSDIRELTAEYVNMFTEDAAFILDSQPCKGTAGWFSPALDTVVNC